jgi:hypothetical protein
LLIGNLFALRSTDPAALRAAPDPVGPRNDERLLALEDAAALVVCAWGEGGAYGDRDRDVLPRLRAPHCLVRLRSGRPGHPLYKRADLEPVPL